MKSTLKSRNASQSQDETGSSRLHREPSRGVQTKPLTRGAESSAGVDSAPRVALQRKQLHAAFGHAIQRQTGPEDEELLQGKFATVQRQGPEEEELLQGKFDPVQRQGPEDEELLQGKFATVQRQGVEEEELLQGKFDPVQRQAGPEEEELLQGKFKPIQRQGFEEEEMLQGKFAAVQRVEEEESLQGKFASESIAQLKQEPAAKPNDTGLPDKLKSGIENLSGMSMDQVRVHYNSSQPAQLNALAYAQGTDIHVASGQERHVPHEAWHVVQQAEGRVQPTMQMKDGVPVNDDQGLEREADLMGAKALQAKVQKGSDPFNGADEMGAKAVQMRRIERSAFGFPIQKGEALRGTAGQVGGGKGTVQRARLATIVAAERDLENVHAAVEDNEGKGDEGGHMIGFGAAVDGGLWKTQVKWGPPDASGEGSWMEANPLGPEHPEGSAPVSDEGNVWTQRARTLTGITGKTYVAGHLLNDNIGGPGNDARNLTAIPAKPTNAAHSDLVEEAVKKLVNEDMRWVYYKVEVTYADDGPNRYASEFKCRWHTFNVEGHPYGDTKTKTIKAPSPTAMGARENLERAEGDYAAGDAVPGAGGVEAKSYLGGMAGSKITKPFGTGSGGLRSRDSLFPRISGEKLEQVVSDKLDERKLQDRLANPDPKMRMTRTALGGLRGGLEQVYRQEVDEEAKRQRALVPFQPDA